MLIKLEDGVIINTDQIVAISCGKVYMTAGFSQENYFNLTDKDIDNIMMLHQPPLVVLNDYKLEDMGGIFKGSN